MYIPDESYSRIHRRTIEKEEEQAALEHGAQLMRRESLKLPVMLLGAAIYAVGMNSFLKPLHLYAGGMMGFSQLIQTMLHSSGILKSSMDISGILYYLMNVPAMLICLKKLPRRFIVKTIFAVTAITVFLTLIPIPKDPVMDDRLANCMMAGLICGAGVGIILRMGACDGGMSLIGMLLSSQKTNVSIGRVSLASNILLYSVCLFLFDVPTVIYSLIYAAFNSFTSDRVHTQNVSCQLLVVTKLEDTASMQSDIMGKLHRGMTELQARGSFTGENEKLFLIFASKYEVNRVRGIIREHDPHAFIALTEGVSIDGHFVKRLT